jgi:hypothetical protein
MRVKILKDFKGSPDGSTVLEFKAEEEADLNDYLYSVIDKSWVKRLDGQPVEIENKAVITEGKTRKTRKPRSK